MAILRQFSALLLSVGNAKDKPTKEGNQKKNARYDPTHRITSFAFFNDHISKLETAYQVFSNNNGTELVNDVDLGFDSSLYQTLVFVYRYGRTGTYYQRTFYKDYYNFATIDTIYGMDAFAYFSIDSNNGHLKVIGGGTYRPFLYKVFGFKAST